MDNLQLNLKAIDLDISESGVWLEYDDGIEFLIARANTPGYRGAVKKIQKIHKRQIDSDTLSDAKADKLAAETMADWVLKDWKGLKNGKIDFEYNRENCIAFLSDERYLEIRRWIMVQADDLENYRLETVKK